MTWAHLEKKRTRIRLYTKSLKEIIIHAVETASPTLMTVSELDQDGVKNITTALELLAPSGGGLILYQSYGNLYAMTALGWLLKEIYMIWAHLEKKRTRLRLYTKSLKEIIIHTVETASPTLMTVSELDQNGVKNITTALECGRLK
nr:hypothetical protein [Tanacetum cinerariifolium]